MTDQKPDLAARDRERGLPARRSLTHAVTWTLVFEVATRISGVFAGILAARWLGPSGRGQLAAVMVWVPLSCALISVGLEQALTRSVARLPQRSRELRSQASRLGWASGAAVGLAIGLVSLTGLGPFAGSVATYLLAVLSALPPLFAINLEIAADRGRGGFIRAAAWATSLAWINLLGICIGLWVTQTPTPLTFAVIFSASCWSCALARWLWHRPPRLRLAAGPRRLLVGRAARFGSAQLPTVCMQHIDLLLAISLLTRAEVGSQAVALAVALAASSALDVYAKVNFAHASASLGNSDASRALRRHVLGVLLTLCVLLPLCVYTAPLIIELAFGRPYLRFESAIAWTVAARIVLHANLTLDLGLRALGRARQAWLVFPAACAALTIASFLEPGGLTLLGLSRAHLCLQLVVFLVYLLHSLQISRRLAV